jgi:protein SCO1/2
LQAASVTHPVLPRASSRERIRERYFPNVTLLTHEGKKVRFYDDLLKDRTLTLNFMFATCNELCPRTTANLVRVQKLLGNRVGRDIFMYSISLKPEQDTPAMLAEYVKLHHVGAGWKFLTGDPRDIEMLRRRLGFTDPDPARDRDLTNHIGNVRYGNEPLQLWAACPGLATPEWIVESLSWVMRSKPARQS